MNLTMEDAGLIIMAAITILGFVFPGAAKWILLGLLCLVAREWYLDQ